MALICNQKKGQPIKVALLFLYTDYLMALVRQSSIEILPAIPLYIMVHWVAVILPRPSPWMSVTTCVDPHAPSVKRTAITANFFMYYSPVDV